MYRDNKGKVIYLGKSDKKRSHRKYSDILASVTAAALAVMNVPFGQIAYAADENEAADKVVVSSAGVAETKTSGYSSIMSAFDLSSGIQVLNASALSADDDDASAEKTITGISIYTNPCIMSYGIGANFDPADLVIEVTYSDNTTEKILYGSYNKSDFSFEPTTFNEVGRFTVTVTYKGQTAQIEDIMVEKYAPNDGDFIFTPPSDLIYDGNAKTAIVKSVKSGMGDITVKYYDEDGNIVAEPINAGTYSVSIDVSDGATYGEWSGIYNENWKFTILPASINDAKLTIDSVSMPFTYKASAYEPRVSVALGAKLLTDTDYEVSYEDNVNAGTAKITVTGKGNYSGTVSETFTIEKATLTPLGVAVDGNVYTSSDPSNVKLTGTVNFAEIGVVHGKFELIDVTAFTEGTNDYKYKFTPEDTTNFELAYGQVTIDVLADTLVSISVIKEPDKTSYTVGECFDPTGLEIEAKYASGMTKTVIYTRAIESLLIFMPTRDKSLTTADTTVTIGYSEGTAFAETRLTITVNKAVPKVTVPTGVTAVYGQTLANVTLPTDDNGTWSWKDSSEQVGNVGTKTFTAKFTPNDADNYSEVEKDVTVTVSPASLSIASATVLSKSYDKTTKADVLEVTFDGLAYSERFTRDVDYTVSAEFDSPNAGENKTITVTVTLLNSEKAKNYELTNDYVQFTDGKITKAFPKVITPNAVACTYKDGETPSLANVDLPSGWTWDDPTQTLTDGDNLCKAVYTPDDTVNYHALYIDVTVTVIKTECEHTHTTTSWNPTDASCGMKVTKTVTCEDCGIALFCANMIKEHEWNPSYTVDTPATCTVPGVKSIHCRNCDETKNVTIIPAAGHTGGTATCTEAAVCEVCSMHYGDPLGHSWDEAYSYDSTSHWHECTRCDEINDKEDHISDGGVVTTPATEEETGLKTYSCTVCGTVIKTEVIPATGSDEPTEPDQPSEPDQPTKPDQPSQPTYPTPSYSGSSSTANNQPQIKGENGKTGWAAIKDAIASAENGSITIDMNGSYTIPKNIIEEAAKRHVDLIIEISKNIRWTIRSETITNAKQINLKVTKGANKIPTDLISEISGDPVVQLSLAHNGEFGFDAVMDIDLGSKYNGLYANLYYYNKKTNTLEFTDSSEITNGTAALMFTHASDWAIVISESSPMIFEDVGSSAGIAEDSGNIGLSETIPTMLIIVSAAATAAVILRKRLKSKN